MNAPDAVAALRTLAATVSPDARLIAVCDRYVVLTEEASRLLRRVARGHLKEFRATMGERSTLEAEIAGTPARTLIGRLAKAEIALETMGKDTKGSIWDIPRSVLKDFIMNASGGAKMRGPSDLEEPPDLEEV